MPKDYKNARKVKDAPSQTTGNILPFITGLTVGVLASFIIYLNLDGLRYKPFDSTTKRSEQTQTRKQGNDNIADTKKATTVPTPRFDFYNILPNKEINISEWVAEDQESRDIPVKDDSNLYILQVGSFKQFEAADQIKAQLALLGIIADIQRVVINGQDTRYRVRIGPHKDQHELNRERDRLRENNLEFMVLKLGADDAANSYSSDDP